MNGLAEAWDARIESLVAKLPDWARRAVTWLRQPSRRVLRIGAALLFIVGGCLSILPVLGLWMLPLGLALLSQDVPALKPYLERAARWCDRKWASWRGGPNAPKTALQPARRPRAQIERGGTRH